MMLDEALWQFAQIVENPNATLDDLAKLVDGLSVKDYIAPDNATTHLYTKVGG